MEEKNKNSQKEEKDSFSVKLKSYIKNLFDFSNYDFKTKVYMIIFMFLFAISLYLLYYIYFVDPTFLYIIVIVWFVNPIISLGIWGIFLFIGVMAIQGLLVPIPSELVLLAAGMIWGLWFGALMGIIGSMAAGLLCYYIAYRGGRPLAEKFVGESALNMADKFIERYGTGAILIARLLPFVAFDPISYISGVLKYPIKKYTLATFIGSIPRAFFYAYLGSQLIQHEPGKPINISKIPFSKIEAQAALFNNILLMILGVLIIIFVAYYLFGIYWEKKNLYNNKLN